jgi:2-polyprenyl-3-methyl-5-hydroxy-6-metoxy-1,4-benzoquinol methylase
MLTDQTTLRNQNIISFGRYVSYWFNRSPKRVLHSQTYYKFATRLIGRGKNVLDVGCNEGLGTFLIAKECGRAKGIDFDVEALESAKSNFQQENIEFEETDALTMTPTEIYDAVVSFDVIEHIYPRNIDAFFTALKASLKPEGLVVIGTPSLISQEFASETAKKGHINIYSHERLEEEMRKHFRFVFLFAGNDEVVHTGYLPLAHYFIATGCGKIGM